MQNGALGKEKSGKGEKAPREAKPERWREAGRAGEEKGSPTRGVLVDWTGQGMESGEGKGSLI